MIQTSIRDLKAPQAKSEGVNKGIVPSKMTREEYFTFITQQPDKAPKGIRSKNFPDTWVETGKTGEYRGEKTYYLKNTDTGEIREWPINEMARMESVVLTYDELKGNIKPKQDTEDKLRETIFGKI